MNFSSAGLLCSAERTVRAGPPSVCIAEGKVSSQDATVIVQDVSVTGADALLRRVLLSLRRFIVVSADIRWVSASSVMRRSPRSVATRAQNRS